MTVSLVLQAGVAVLLGLVFGSFASLAAWRLPRGEQVLSGRSRCPQCRRHLGPKELVPVMSYLRSGGKCLHCGAPIGARYLLIECACGVLFYLAFVAAGATPEAFLLGLLGLGLVIVTAVDLEHQIIPDQALLALGVAGVLYWLLPGNGTAEWMNAAFGAGAGFTLAAALRLAFRYLKGRESLGFGDVKFFAVAGLWVGLRGLADFMLLAGLAGILFAVVWRWRGQGEIFPFGPALAFSLYSLALWAAAGQPQPVLLIFR